LCQLYKNYGLRPYKIGYDQRYAKVFTDRCGELYGFETEMLAQGRALSNAMKLTEADLESRLINYNNHAVDRWCLGNTCIKVDNVENIMPVKARGESSARIDGGVTMIMIEEMYRRHRTEYMTLIGG
jgi:phage terminase large subunit-like protein